MTKFVLEGEGLDPIENPSSAKVQDVIENLGRLDTSFAVLISSSGDYIQAAGDGKLCTVERRELDPLNHWKAHYEKQASAIHNGQTLLTGAGELTPREDEFLSLDDAVDLFIAFLENHLLPKKVNWRSMNQALGI